MKLVVNIEKQHFYFLVILVAVLFVVGVSALNPGKLVGHSASEVEPDTFGGSISSLYTFPGNIKVEKNITLGGVSRGNWTYRLSARNITAGSFGAETGNGNYGFPGDLKITGITTTSGGLVIEVKSSNPSSPAVGRMWLIS